MEYSKVVETGQPLIKENLVYKDALDGNLLARTFNIHVVKLGEGIVSIWRDVTEEKRVEESEWELRTLAESLQDIAIILNSSLDRETVLDHILAQLGRVVPYDSVNLMLIENDVARIVRCRGYEERGLQDTVFLHRLNVTETKNLKWMAETGKPMTIPDTWKSTDWIRLPKSEWIHSYAGAPLRVNGRTIGFLNVNSSTPRLYNEKYADRLQTFAVQSALAIENAQLYQEVQALALTDVVTGVYNRRGMLELGHQEFERSIRFRHPLSVLMIDIDHFKRTNDQLGHEGGDQVLRFLAKLLQNSLRKSDNVCRYGGEEFLVLLSETNISSAMVVGERLRIEFEAATITINGVKVQCTMSIGAASLQGETSDLLELINQADNALYEAKQSGRNRLVAFESKSI
jgi:diguanylate cyclase (GGDEF)-like protein